MMTYRPPGRAGAFAAALLSLYSAVWAAVSLIVAGPDAVAAPVPRPAVLPGEAATTATAVPAAAPATATPSARLRSRRCRWRRTMAAATWGDACRSSGPRCISSRMMSSSIPGMVLLWLLVRAGGEQGDEPGLSAQLRHRAGGGALDGSG